jgi:ABC-2 type transport system permease protein
MVLLVMPMALVLIVSLVQDNVMQATGESPIRVLFVDQDHGVLATSVAKLMRADRGLELVETIDGLQVSAETARRAVARGDYQFLILIAPGTSATLKARLEEAASASFDAKPEEVSTASNPVSPARAVEGLTLYLDPTVPGSLRTAVVNALHRIMLGIELQEKGATLSRTLPQKLKDLVADMAPPGTPRAPQEPDIHFTMDSDPILALTEKTASDGPSPKRPTAAQQNVPAWALFGMFFIVVPLSSTIIRERQTGTFRRLMTLPISPVGLLAGKVSAYVLVCLAQLVLMLGVGWLALPLLGTSGLVVPPAQWPAVSLIGAAAALAATGYGIMVGTLAKSHEQASMFGAVSIVIAAALGGIMIPAYVMPRYMQTISTFSPLAWGLNAFQDIFVRGGTIRTIGPRASLLSGFFVVTITVAWLSLRGQRSAE